MQQKENSNIELYFQEVEDDETTTRDVFYRLRNIDQENVNIIEAANHGIIIYDTRINKECVKRGLDGVKIISSTKEAFENKILELNKKD